MVVRRASSTSFYRSAAKVFLGTVLLCCLIFFTDGTANKDHKFWSSNVSRDLRKYIQPETETSIITNNNLCATKNDSVPYLLVIVCSSIAKSDARNAIRETWGARFKTQKYERYGIRLAFLVGLAESSRDQDNVDEESERYRDIIQENFSDSYYNLTLKSVMMLKWAKRYCGDVRYLFKVDDDNYLNLDNLMKLLNMFGRKKLVAGHLSCYSWPFRRAGSKWYCPDYMYDGYLYPPYVSGPAYLISGDMIPVLYRTALETPLLHLEDVFLTGIVAQKANVRPKGVDLFAYYPTEVEECTASHYATIHDLEPNEIREIWREEELRTESCGSVDFSKIQLTGCRLRFDAH